MQALADALQDSDRVAPAYLADPLLSGFGLPQLKLMLDIAMENQRTEGFVAAEVGTGTGGLTKQVCFRVYCFLF